MAHYQLTIKANKRPETLERILRVIRHRGFEVKSLNVEENDTVFDLKLTLTSQRPLSLLTHQLDKLFDVIEIN
ncbi:MULTISPECIES: acetolactate synthase 2 small subunit [Mannheimia]|uniref:Acetolactate synthase 2 small subunit n=1 Tax=Mannheimia pernigra TaxID=111844 RepID=A0A7H8UTN2_9PAST|nr:MULTISPECIES: acetolactate synthase 2 small subunit [Mannheimia]QHB17329.1 acetolactate synthase 2 small subunit [Mannheimia pernigra]QLB40188.1 acetolactate synthase 2 small subunit [Mannheimia pernigra]QLB42177.1 acetolactate synthase 2 small subunit [Mannheimia pernigra]QLB44069.1 acetolactate synthase 2 small subunit [Mannheimia pernigra]QTM00587.1 acetolactate synthase 2 small subunit [Mannheimia sp. ZY171111]